MDVQNRGDVEKLRSLWKINHSFTQFDGRQRWMNMLIVHEAINPETNTNRGYFSCSKIMAWQGGWICNTRNTQVNFLSNNRTHHKHKLRVISEIINLCREISYLTIAKKYIDFSIITLSSILIIWIS